MTTHVGSLAYRISDDKARARDQFLPRYYTTDTPCKTDPDRWHSESLAIRNEAARACVGNHTTRPCPLLDLCDAWASAKPAEKWGVWGGKDRAAKSTKKKGKAK